MNLQSRNFLVFQGMTSRQKFASCQKKIVLQYTIARNEKYIWRVLLKLFKPFFMEFLKRNIAAKHVRSLVTNSIRFLWKVCLEKKVVFAFFSNNFVMWMYNWFYSWNYCNILYFFKKIVWDFLWRIIRWRKSLLHDLKGIVH